MTIWYLRPQSILQCCFNLCISISMLNHRIAYFHKFWLRFSLPIQIDFREITSFNYVFRSSVWSLMVYTSHLSSHLSLSFCYISDIFNGITKWQYFKLHFLIVGLERIKRKFLYIFFFNTEFVFSDLVKSTSFNSWIFLEMSMYTITSYTNDMSFIPNPYAFSSSCFTEMVGTSKIMLNISGESSYYCQVSYFWEETFNNWPL